MNTEQLKRDPMKETEQTLLDQIKDQVAKENHRKDWKDLDYSESPIDIDRKFWKIVCERYATAKAKASCEATLKKASENAKWGRQDGTNKRAIVKSSITDPSNIVIVSPVNQNSNGETRF